MATEKANKEKGIAAQSGENEGTKAKKRAGKKLGTGKKGDETAHAIAGKIEKEVNKAAGGAVDVNDVEAKIETGAESISNENPSVKKEKKAVTKTPSKKQSAKKLLPLPQVSTELSSGEASSVDAGEMVQSEPTKKALKITFQLRFSTNYGQRLFITGNDEVLGNNDLSNALPMEYLNNEYWIATAEFPDKQLDKNIIYNYYLVYEDGSDTLEWGDDKIINPSKIDGTELLLVDTWNYAGFVENTFLLEPFKQVLFKNNFTRVEVQQPSTYTHTFRIKAPLLPKDHVVFLAGNIEELKDWNTEDPLLMSKNEDGDWWTINLDLTNATLPAAYKYGVYNLQEKKYVQFEDGENRTFYGVGGTKKQTVVSDGFIRLSNNDFKGAGVAIPVFSLRSNNGLGVGEFNDLKLLVDWAKKIGFKLLQILPINDTTATYTFADSYPYAAISAFALHPIYLHLDSVVNDENRHLLSSLVEKQQRLNNLDVVDYEQVIATKLAFLSEIFPSQKSATFSTPDFVDFFQTNTHWLVPYAAFSFFRDKYQTADFNAWLEHKVYSKEQIAPIAESPMDADENLSIYYFIQYHLHLQLKAATDYAHQNGIIVKGDIPIGIFRNSCDAWQQPELYNMDMQAGAPPDDFAVKGQNWGFPTYNWENMAKDGFNWWKRRFTQMSYYFDAFRIDHILGFFRIWSIPMDAIEGILGHFVPAIPIHVTELHQYGIYSNTSRLTEPFINDAILFELFGNESLPVKRQFLEPSENGGIYRLLPQFNTQRKIEQYFGSVAKSGFNSMLKRGLFDLISNVILFEVPGSEGTEFHFRISVESTSSFRELDQATQNNLRQLYIDYFYRRQDNFWKQEAMKKLPELKRSTNMLICGEDLGMVPATVPGVMKDLAILSLEIQRMPKDISKEFFHPNDAPYLSVVTPSTHDMSTIRGWWEEDRVKTQRFFNTQLGQQGEAPFYCEPWINRLVVVQHLYSPAMWSIFQLQDLLGIDGKLRRENPNDERINVPANPKHYWQYRMHVSLENLEQETTFNNDLRELITLSGR